MDILRIWGQNLARRREALELSQQKIADQVGVRQTTYSRWENGVHEPPLHLRPAIAKVLGCSVYDLFPYPDGDTPPREEVGA